MRAYVPNASGTPPHVAGRHRLPRADVLSPPSAVTVRGKQLKNRKLLQRALCRLHSSFGDVEVDSRCFEAGMPQQNLNGAEVRPGIQQVGGERMAQRIIAMLMNFTQRRSAIVITLYTA